MLASPKMLTCSALPMAVHKQIIEVFMIRDTYLLKMLLKRDSRGPSRN